MLEDQNCKNSFDFDKFKMKKKKYAVLLLSFFIEKEKVCSFTLAFVYFTCLHIIFYRYSQGKHTVK